MSLPTYQATGATTIGNAVISPDNFVTIQAPWPVHQAGDIGLFFVYDDGVATWAQIDPAGGWALVDSANASTARLKVFWKRAASAAEGAAYFETTPPNAFDTHAVGVIVTYRGCVASGNPINVSANSTRAASTSCTSPTITTSEADAMIILAATRDNDSAAAAWSAQTNTALASITERVDTGTAIGTGGGLSVTEGTKATAGAVGTTSSTVTSSAGGMITFALRGITAIADTSSFFNFF